MKYGIFTFPAHDNLAEKKSFTRKYSLACFSLWCMLLFFPINLLAEKGDTPFKKLFEEMEQNGFGSPLASKHLDSLYILAAQEPDSLALKAWCIYAEASINQYLGNNDTTIVPRIRDLEKLLNPTLYHFENLLLNYSLSLVYYVDGEYTQAFSLALQVLEQFRKTQNSKYITGALATLGNICSAIHSYDMAENYYEQALLFASNNQQQYRIRMNIYNIWGLTGKSALAIDSLQVLVSTFKQSKDTMLLTRSYMNLGNCYAILGELPNAKACYDTLLTFVSFLGNSDILFGIYQNMGAYYLLMNDFNIALNYFEQAKDIALREGKSERLTFAYLGMSKTFEQIGHVDSSLAYLKLYAELNDSNIEKNKSLEAYQAYVTAAVESTQKELTIAEQQIELKNRRFITTIGFSVGIILVISLFLIVVQQKKRFKEAENKDLKERLESTQLIELLQEERIAAQTREITSHSLMLSNKNEVLRQIAEVVNQMPATQKKVREINQIIKNNLSTDHAWDDFMLHFEKVHPDFFNKLSVLSSDLTKNDLRLCAYIRIGIAQKQIAQILNISYGSTRIHRYRVKKKLGLSEEQNLDDFIRNI